jgi:peptidylprolyl isomerase
VVACASLPEISSTIPALPAGTPCPRPLFTVTRVSDLHADYISPLVSPDLRAILDPPPVVISLVYADEKVGSGPLVLHDKYTEVLYTGYLPNGTVFDSNTNAAKPFGFVLGAHHVIAGWDMGLEGMHVGGKRRLFVPYQLAYGDRGNPPRIPPKSMLIFDIEVLKQSDFPPPTPSAMRPMPRPVLPATKPATSPAGTAAPPPVTSTTPPASTQPTPPSSEPRK